MPRWVESINFRKIVTVLAVTFGIALGSCGITAVLARIPLGLSQVVGLAIGWLAVAEVAVIVLSAVALIVVLLVWILASILGRFKG